MKNALLLAVALSLVSVASCAYELRFYLTFIGAMNGNVTGVAKAKALSQQTNTFIDNAYGLTYNEKSFFGASANWISVYDISKPSDTGNITFGASYPNAPVHVISFELIGYQVIANWHGYQHSAEYYNVTGGAGAFAGADGVLSSTATLNYTDNSYFQHITGSLWIQGAPPGVSIGN